MLWILLAWVAFGVQAGNDYPHSTVNGVTCFSCHDIHGGYAKFLKVTNPHTPENVDDTEANNLCWSCHNDAVAPYVNPHSSHMIDDGYGNWAIQCITCHNPHKQEQYRAYDPESRLEDGYVGAVAQTTLTADPADPDLPWEVDEFKGFVVYPNIAETEYSYRIVGNSSTTLDVSSGNAGTGIDLTKVSIGDTFAIIHGRLVKNVINTPNSGPKTVKLLRPTGDNSFADADTTYDGPCQVCHTQTNHMRNDGLAPDQLHLNADHDDPTGTTGEKCTEKCHLHVGGFGHGKGYTKADLCVECHGHEPGTLYDPDATYPYTAGTVASRGFGTTGPHTTHTESSAGISPASAGDDDQRGPGIYCSTCHDTDNMPTFKSGTDADADGLFSLDETDVCDVCHSPGGTYNGVDTTGESVGAKDNWNTGGVYDEDGILKAGREKWCAGCHDDAAPEISGVTAPNVIGFEDGAYTYGTGYGFYKTGHGLPSNQTYPAKAGLQNGAGKRCENCHDTTLNHIDGLQRTFDCGTGNECSPTEYRESYRLKLIDDVNPLVIPRPFRPTGVTPPDDFRLCFQSGCHDPDRFLIQGEMMTNFRDETRGDSPENGETALIDPFNAHAYHLSDSWVYRFRPDWEGLHTDGQSLITCITCHNVHGSNQLSMIRDGRLINTEPGFVVYYNNGVDPLGPSATTLADSTATAFGRDTPVNVCENCHWGGSGGYQKFDRTPPGPQQVPTLDWTGEADYLADGVHPNSAVGGSNFVFRIDYTDGNGESPKYVQIWVDEDDSGTYESEEKYEMSKVDPTDLDYTDGALYRKTLVIARRGDGNLNYRFYATDDKDEATGAPVADSTLTLTNNAPTLAWTGEPAYSADGADPNSGAGGDSFGFRIQYTDMDNEAPSSVQVWIDENDNSAYEAGEKYALTEVDAGDVDYTDGKLYATTRAISSAGDEILDYRFYASDGEDDATGVPVADSFIVVAAANNTPILAWTGEASYGDDGVNPDSTANCAIPEFRVKYSDIENVAPSSIQIWVDENDNDIYEAGEKYDMDAIDVDDNEYFNGKLYTKTLDIAYAGDGALKYRFYASDGIDDAAGTAVADSPVTVVDSLEVPAEYATVQAAIDDAVDGDYVCVSDGTHSGQIDFSNKAITLKSFNGAATTILDGNGSNTAVMLFNSGEGAGSILDGFTVDNQAAANTQTRGIVIVDSSPTIRNAIIQGNATTNNYGAGIYISGGGATIENCVIGNEDNPNTANSGAGMYFQESAAGTLTIRDSAITYNTAGMNGGGIYLSNITNPTVIENTSITNNYGGARFGGGIRANNSPLLVTDSHIDNNSTAWSGGGLYLSSATATFENSTVSGNSTGFGSAGGIYFTGDSSTLTINDSTIADNLGTPFDGGGFYIAGTSQSAVINNSTISGNSGRSGGGVRFLGSDNTLSIRDSRLVGNIGAFGAGGLAVTGGALTNTVTVERTVIAGNYADGAAGSGGGVYIASSADDPDTAGNEATFISSTFTNCTVTGNKAFVGGAGFQISGIGTTVDVMNCTLSGNTAPWGGGIRHADATLTVNNSILWGNMGSGLNEPEINESGGTVTVTNTDIRQSGYEGDGNMTVDPLFVYPRDVSLSPTIDGNYHLQSDSPMLDKGTAVGAPVDDIDGDARPQEGGYDLGSDEMVYSVFSNAIPELSWTGESMSYVTDGANPDTGAGGDGFDFRIKYTDADNEAPASIQVWIDQNDDGTYDPGEKHSLTIVGGGDGDYTNGELYAKTLPVASAGDGNISYRFYASDGVYGAVGTPTSDSTIYDLSNVAPTIDWTGQTDYSTDGVNPDSALSGSDFEFRVEFTDANNDMPPVIQVWVDTNDNGTYEEDEKTDMTAFDGDSDSTDGKFYTATIALSKAGDDSFNYRFYAADYLAEATGAPQSNSTVSVTNNPPVLAWTGEANYVSDGVNPDSESGGNNVEFQISYTDVDNEAPASIQVWVDRTDNGAYEAEEVELHDMFEVDAGDLDYTDGKLYSRILPLIYVADGTVDYRFYASEGIDDATGTPTTDSTASVTPVVSGVAPTIEWSGETGYTADGVAPDSGAGGANYTFRLKYTDDNAPAVIQVWVDEDDSGTYEADEKFAMGGADHTDVSDADGKLYTLKRIVPFVADGSLIYRFYASDGVGDATGAPTSNGSIGVSDPLAVPGEYATIQAAIDVASAGNYVLVSDGTYDENINFNGKAITVQSLNGAAVTTIDANNAVGPVVTFNSGETSAAVLDGFTLINGIGIGNYGGGIYITGSSPTIKNSTITGHTGFTRGGGFYITGAASDVTIDNSNIDNNAATLGGGVYVTTDAVLTVTNSTLNNNSTSFDGGGICAVSGTTLNLYGNVFSGNQARYGAGVEIASSVLDLGNTTMSGNTATRGGGVYIAGATASATIDATHMDNNTASLGGGLYMTTDAVATVTNSTFNGNTTGFDGAGIYAVSSAAVNVYKSVISGNQARWGGGVGLGDAAIELENTTISGNRSTKGGGIYISSASAVLTMTNSTVGGNYGVSYGGGLFADGTVTLTNSIFWGNISSNDNEIYNVVDSANVFNSDINKDGYDGINGSIRLDPLFVSPIADPAAEAPTISGDYHLQIGSPAIDVGTATGAPADDIDGDARPLGAGYEMGSDEYVP
ncbi:right-handed parallel beta-helix repeat-containing protein [Pseudomonadota bacterium]